MPTTMIAISDYRARYYDPTIGRFLSEDPAGFSGSGTNSYAYVRNSPINLIDSMGLCPNQLCAAGALEEVIAASETRGQPNNGYGTNNRGTVTSSPLFPQYLGQTNVQLSLSQLANLTSNPQMFVGNSSAFGRYQITNRLAQRYNFTDWTPSGQDDAAATVLNALGAVQAAMQGNFQDAMWDMNNTWVGMPDGRFQNLTLDQAQQIYNNALSYLPECQ